MYVVSTKRDITHVIQFRSFQTEPSKYLFLYLKVGYGMAGANPGFREEGANNYSHKWGWVLEGAARGSGGAL